MPAPPQRLEGRGAEILAGLGLLRELLAQHGDGLPVTDGAERVEHQRAYVGALVLAAVELHQRLDGSAIGDAREGHGDGAAHARLPVVERGHQRGQRRSIADVAEHARAGSAHVLVGVVREAAREGGGAAAAEREDVGARRQLAIGDVDERGGVAGHGREHALLGALGALGLHLRCLGLVGDGAERDAHGGQERGREDERERPARGSSTGLHRFAPSVSGSAATFSAAAEAARITSSREICRGR